VPPSDVMPSHCRCEGPGWVVWVWVMEGREGRDESESHRCSAALRSRTHLHLAWIWAPPLGTGVLLAMHPTRPLRGPATALSTDARSLELIDLCSTTRFGTRRMEEDATRSCSKKHSRSRKRSNAQTGALNNATRN
jgi:hypothetical protein